MKKNVFKKIMVVMTVVMAMAAMTACNKKIKVTYDYDASQYVKLPDYKGIKVSMDEASIRNSIIENRIQSDLDEHTVYSEITTRGAQDGDQITVTFTATIGGMQVEGFSSNGDYSLILGKDTFVIDGFVDALYGLSAGDTKVVTLVVPEGIQDADDYVGKRIVYDISVVMVEQPVAPMITDAYVKENFDYNTVDEYRAGLEAELASSIDDEVYEAKYNLVMDTLLKESEVTGYPEDVLNTKREDLNKSLTFYSTMYGLSVEEYCQKTYSISFEEFVKNSVAQDMIIQQIIVTEGITLDEYYYKGELESFAADQGYSNKTSFVEKYGKDAIVRGMLIDKATKLVMENAIVE